MLRKSTLRDNSLFNIIKVLKHYLIKKSRVANKLNRVKDKTAQFVNLREFKYEYELEKIYEFSK